MNSFRSIPFEIGHVVNVFVRSMWCIHFKWAKKKKKKRRKSFCKIFALLIHTETGVIIIILCGFFAICLFSIVSVRIYGVNLCSFIFACKYLRKRYYKHKWYIRNWCLIITTRALKHQTLLLIICLHFSLWVSLMLKRPSIASSITIDNYVAFAFHFFFLHIDICFMVKWERKAKWDTYATATAHMA